MSSFFQGYYCISAMALFPNMVVWSTWWRGNALILGGGHSPTWWVAYDCNLCIIGFRIFSNLSIFRVIPILSFSKHFISFILGTFYILGLKCLKCLTYLVTTDMILISAVIIIYLHQSVSQFPELFHFS
jgi:hypothetical protein